MYKKLTAALLAVAAMVALSGVVVAAPSLDIDKPPVQPSVSWTGPSVDPQAAQGQWFLDKATRTEQVRTHEFYDDAQGYGGGSAGTLAIQGKVTNIVYAGANIQSFTVTATIHNDTPATVPEWSGGLNSHDETLNTSIQYQGDFRDVKLVCSFAMDPQIAPPAAWTPPYTYLDPPIYSNDHEQLAWYCWSPNNLIDKFPYGDYFVPTFDFGDIAAQTSASRSLTFTTSSAGIPPGDLRYDVIKNSLANGDDIFANRAASLKISDWVDLLGTDTGSPYLDFGHGSDVSVFHNIVEEPIDKDWGDAPDQPYPTLAVNNGANHIIVSGLLPGPVD